MNISNTPFLMATATASPLVYLADFITDFVVDSVATAGDGDDDDVRALKRRLISVQTIPIPQFKIAYKPDPGVSGYWTEKGEPRVLNVVAKAEGVLANHSFCNRSPPDWSEFNKLTAQLVIGADSFSVRGGRTATVECLSGAGSLRVGAEFLATYYPVPTIYIPQQTWGNHKKIFRFAGLTVKTYRYYDAQTCGLHLEGMKEDLGSAAQGSIVLLHACAQGVDPTHDQWNQIKKLIRGNGLLPLFDIAYQGFASGRLDVDAYSVRMFVEDGDECLIAQSYAENMCLYAERVGAFSIVCPCEKVAGKVEGQLKLVIGHMNYNLHGAYVVSTILKDSGMFKDWTIELQAMADDIVSMRQVFFAALSARGTPGDWSHITKQTGMFTFTGLSPKQAAFVTKKHHILMTTDGQISMAGLSSKTLPHLVDAIHEAVIYMN